MILDYVLLGCTEKILSLSETDGNIYNLVTETGSREITQAEILAGAKVFKIGKIKKIAAFKISEIYPFIDPTSEQVIGLYTFAYDMYMAMIPAARSPLEGNLLTLQGIYSAAVVAIAVVNGLTTVEDVEAYDPETDPVWPEG